MSYEGMGCSGEGISFQSLCLELGFSFGFNEKEICILLLREQRYKAHSECHCKYFRWFINPLLKESLCVSLCHSQLLQSVVMVLPAVDKQRILISEFQLQLGVIEDTHMNFN